MLQRAYTAFHKKMLPQPVPFELHEVMDAWSKVDQILRNAYLDTHVETAQRMFNNMLHRFGFTEEQKRSPLIAGMQDKINKIRVSEGIMVVRK
jgi:hypothetical protein